jgi:hypothetical protein
MMVENPSFQTPERGIGLAPDVLIVLGRGINYYIKDMEVKLRPTGLFMQFDPKIRDQIAEINLLNPPDGDTKDAIVAGGNSNILAAVHFLRNLEKEGKYVREIIFAAGRPPYLQKLSDSLTEGDIMLEKFNKLKNFYRLPDVPVGNFRDNRNTWDDVRETVGHAKEMEYKNVAMITVGLHVPRVEEFIKKALIDAGGSAEEININVLDGWQILVKAGSHFQKIFDFVKNTKAYQNTAEMEERGIRMIKDGTYIYSK